MISDSVKLQARQRRERSRAGQLEVGTGRREQLCGDEREGEGRTRYAQVMRKNPPGLMSRVTRCGYSSEGGRLDGGSGWEERQSASYVPSGKRNVATYGGEKASESEATTCRKKKGELTLVRSVG